MTWVGSGETPTPSEETVLPERLRLLHLSDIHFSIWDDDEKWDLDLPIRRKLIEDAALVASDLGGADAILISGDIAFQASITEYERAARWLGLLCEAVNCPEENVWVVPGNHDVDRTVLRQNQLTQSLQYRLRHCPLGELDELLARSLLSSESEGQLLAPLAAYNAFALPYKCALSGKDAWWEAAIHFGPGYRLVMRGMTTVFVSDYQDNTTDNQLILGSAQYTFEAHPTDFILSMAHHPPNWLRDGVRADRDLTDRAVIQLWGHEHTHSIRNVDHSLQISAGAVQPERRELWDPRYNFITVTARPSATVEICVYPRRWNQSLGRFEGSGEGRFGYPRCETVTAPGAGATVHTVVDNTDVADAVEEVVMPSTSEEAASSPRRLAFRLGRLPFEVRLDVLREVGLLPPDHVLPPDQELFRGALARANAENRIEELRAAVERRYER